jgi:hypothetical protein
VPSVVVTVPMRCLPLVWALMVKARTGSLTIVLVSAPGHPATAAVNPAGTAREQNMPGHAAHTGVAGQPGAWGRR